MRLQPPDAEHWLGTDELGRDIFSRLLYGARITLYIAGLTALIITPLGLLIGATAGYLGGRVDTLLMRLVDIFLAFPSLILALAFVAALGPGIENAIIAISLSAPAADCPSGARRNAGDPQMDYIAAVRLQGIRPAHHPAPRDANVSAVGGGACDAEYGGNYSHRRRAGLSRSWRAGPQPGMGRDAGFRARVHAEQWLDCRYPRFSDFVYQSGF